MLINGGKILKRQNLGKHGVHKRGCHDNKY